MVSSATQPPPRRRRPPRHNFVVSAITFEGFKLRSSNLTHALFIQISRTSSITDISVTLLGSHCTLTCIYLNSNQAAQGHKYHSNPGPAGRLSFEHL